MATNGFERTLSNGLIRRYINLPDISALSELVSARGQDGATPPNDLKAKIVNGRLSFSAAGEISIFKAAQSLAQPTTFDEPGGKTIMTLGESDDIISDDNAPINIQSSVAMTAKGFVDLLVGISP